MGTRSFSRRDVLKASGAASAAALAPRVAGASRPMEFAASQRAQELEEAELTFYFGANPQEAATRQLVIDAFMEKYPHIRIKPETAEGDAVQELQIRFAGGAGPDIMMGWHSYAALAARDIFADLNPFIEADAEYADVVANDHVPDLVRMFQMDGKQYILPEQYTGVVLYYNKKLFEEAGVEPPPTDWTDTSWSYDRFLETAQALTKEEDGRITQFGFTDAWWPPLSAFVVATSNGGDWFDQYLLPTKSTVTDPNIVEGVQWYADLANVHHVKPTVEQSATEAGPDMFMGGRAAMALVGHWMYPAFTSVEGLDFDVGVLPVGPNGTTAKNNLDSTGLGISSTTEYPEHAWEFVKFCTGPEGQRLIAESGLFVPVLKSVMNSDAYTNAHSQIENEQVFIDGIDHGIHQPVTPVWNEIVTVWVRETEKVLSGDTPAVDAMPSLEEEIDSILEAGVSS